VWRRGARRDARATLVPPIQENSMLDRESTPFGIKLSTFFGAILVLTYAVATVAPQADEDTGVKLEYAALSY